MGDYNSPADFVAQIQNLRDRLIALERQTQQGTVPLARASTTTFQTVPSVVELTVAFDTEVFDTADMWDLTDPTKMYARRPGVYLITARGQFVGNGQTGTRYITARTNAGSPVNSMSIVDGGNGLSLVLADTYKLAVGDHVQVYAGNSSIASQLLSLASLSMTYLGPAT